MVVGTMEGKEGFRRIKDDEKAVKMARELGKRFV